MNQLTSTQSRKRFSKSAVKNLGSVGASGRIYLGDWQHSREFKSRACRKEEVESVDRDSGKRNAERVRQDITRRARLPACLPACVSVCVSLIKYYSPLHDLYSVDCEGSGAIRKVVSVVPRCAIADVEADAVCLLPCEKEGRREGCSVQIRRRATHSTVVIRKLTCHCHRRRRRRRRRRHRSELSSTVCACVEFCEVYLRSGAMCIFASYAKSRQTSISSI